MQVKDMTIEQFKTLIRETIDETLEEFLGDPDEGKEIKDEVKQRLLELRKRREAENAEFQQQKLTKVRIKSVMSYSVEYEPEALADLDNLTQLVRNRIIDKI